MILTRRDLLLKSSAVLALGGCAPATDADLDGAAHIEVFDPALKDIIDVSATFEELGRGYGWSEGPAWDRARRALYFTDVPGNVAYKWTSAEGVQVFMDPSGVDGDAPGFREPGANGLWYARDGSLIVCNHGKRGVERLNLDTMERELLVDQYQGNAFNSPNDVVEAADGSLYFTDPPYGLEGLDASPLKRQSANGVYCLHPDGELQQLLSDMTFPNGVALSPDGAQLYVSQSDPDVPLIRRLTLASNGAIIHDEVLFDAMPFMGDDAPGLPDGLAVSGDGTLFATGPGGVFILDPSGRPLGRIRTGRGTANCAFGEDGRTLFMTAHDRLLKIATKALGVQWS